MTSPSSPSSSAVKPASRRIAAGIAGLLCALGALLGAPAAAAPPVISLATWTLRLDSARQQADAAAAHPSRGAMDAVRDTLGLPLQVATGGHRVGVAGDPELKNLSGRTAQDFRDASDQLAAMEDAARQAATAQQPNPKVLSRELALAYRGIATRPSFWARVRHDVWVVLLTIFERIGSLVSAIPLPSWLLALIAVLVAGLVVVILIRRARMVVPERAVPLPGTRRSKQPDWDRMADEALARGDLEAAVRARYRALLAALAARGVVPAAQSLTAGECRRAVSSGMPDLFPAVARATQVFESAIYGHTPVERSEVEALREATQQVRAA
ncbi:MAG TPA: DUF4129 domain-containing protein [Actinomycetota bacterium]|nr:DUF4129 domain-containing protein [Actinomycetota bacterium]